MNNVFNAITNISKIIENKIFTNYDEVIVPDDLYKTNVNVQQYCDEIAKKEFKLISSIKAIVTQDDKKTEILNEDGKYIISFIAIDNIDLLDLGFSVGSIFGVYEDQIEGHSLVAACYVTYGPTFQLVYATKENGVEFYSFDGEKFIDIKPFTLDNKGKINSTDGDVTSFDENHKKLIQGLFNEGYRLRLSNSLSLDMHQILFKKGGLYSSPKTLKDPEGKRDVVFEAYPISFIIELAGGEAIDGTSNISDLKINGDISKKTPLYCGSKYEIEKVKLSEC
ncbi:fructose-bisphosphatase class I [Arcobacteraceae bacterium]|nr:fructose-bisphosphatase class I [Arcobacteraceae bacterium]